MKAHPIIFTLSAALLLCACENSDASFASGTIETTETVVSSEVAGKIVELQVEEGDEIEAGKPVGKIDDTQFRLQMKNLQANFLHGKSAP